MTGEYGDRIGPQGKRHYPAFTRGCYYGPYPGRAAPCYRCQFGLLGSTLCMIGRFGAIRARRLLLARFQ